MKLFINGISLLLLIFMVILAVGSKVGGASQISIKVACNRSGNPGVINDARLPKEVVPVNSNLLEVIKNKGEDENDIDLLSEDRKISSDVNDVEFLLYRDPQNLDKYEKIIFNRGNTLQKSWFQRKKILKILIHGFLQDKSTQFPTDMKNAYLNRTGNKVNILVIDWGKLAAYPPSPLSLIYYPISFQNVFRVGQFATKFLIFLKNAGAIINFSDVHIIGFSLGAHVAGMIGKGVLDLAAGKIGRISGLDPAGPGFKSEPIGRRLDPSTASFVDVIHTNTKLLGYPKALGHVDFYVNGGYIQKHCGLDITGACSHKYAHELYTRSILHPDVLYGCKCDSWENFHKCKKKCSSISLGESCPRSAVGFYYLDP